MEIKKEQLEVFKPIVGNNYYASSVVGLPVKIEVLENNNKLQRSRIKTNSTENGWVEWNRLFKTEGEADMR